MSMHWDSAPAYSMTKNSIVLQSQRNLRLQRMLQQFPVDYDSFSDLNDHRRMGHHRSILAQVHPPMYGSFSCALLRKSLGMYEEKEEFLSRMQHLEEEFLSRTQHLEASASLTNWHNPVPVLSKFENMQETPKTAEGTISQPKKTPMNEHGRRDAQWEAMFQKLCLYKEVHGNCFVPRDYIHDLKLAKWVMNQRVRRHSLPVHRYEKLESIGFAFSIVQKSPEEAWTQMYNRLVEFKMLHGNCCVPVKYADDPKLGRWVHTQRCHGKRSIKPDRRKRLDEIGFVWSALEGTWDSMFERLVAYKEQHGNCFVPRGFKADPKLSVWTMNQRLRFKQLPEHRRKRLEEIGLC